MFFVFFVLLTAGAKISIFTGYTPYTPRPGERKYAYAVYGAAHKLFPDAAHVTTTNFLFFKSHEPWWNGDGKNMSSYAVKAALLLRHPFDAAYSEYKR